MSGRGVAVRLSPEQRQALEAQLPVFVRLAHALIESRDIDPVYPVLRHLQRDLDPEAALWFTTLYLATYNIASALHLFTLRPKPGPLPKAAAQAVAIGVERRGLRGGRLPAHLNDYRHLAIASGSQMGFLTQGFTANNPEGNFEAFWRVAQSVLFNGRWAAFKWAELLKEVHGFPLRAPDMCLRGSSGPQAGLRRLYGLPDAPFLMMESLAQDLRRRATAAGWTSLTWETLETVLCNYDSMAKGRYYVGHDIDEMQHVIEHSSLQPRLLEKLYAARAAVLPAAYLGEVHGWSGVRHEAKGHYQRTGTLVYLSDRPQAVVCGLRRPSTRHRQGRR